MTLHGRVMCRVQQADVAGWRVRPELHRVAFRVHTEPARVHTGAVRVEVRWGEEVSCCVGPGFDSPRCLDARDGLCQEVSNPATVHCGRRVIGRVIKRLSSMAADDKDDCHRVSLSGMRLPRQTKHGSCKAVVRGSSPLAGSDTLAGSASQARLLTQQFRAPWRVA